MIYFTYALIPAVTIAVIMVLLWKKRALPPVLYFLPLGYFSSAMFSALVSPDGLPGFNLRYNFWAIIGYSALVAIPLLPLFRIRDFDPHLMLRSRAARLLARVLALPAWYSASYLWAFGQRDVSAGEFREALNLGQVEVLPTDMWTTVAVGIATFYPVYALLFGLSLQWRRSWFLVGSMAVGTLLGLEHAWVFRARDGSIMVPVMLLLAFQILRPPATSKARRETLALIAAVLVIGGGLFWGITTDRFSGRSDTVFATGIVNYAGCQPYVFAEFVNEQRELYGANLRLPVVANLIGTYEPVVREFPYQWMFGSYALDAYSAWGWEMAFLLMLGGSISASWVFDQRTRIPEFCRAVAMLVWALVVFQGIFYFRMGNRGGNLFLILVCVVCVGAFLIDRDILWRRPRRG